MMFDSILFSESMDCSPLQPACFPDLNLDQILCPILESEKWIDLSPWFWTPLSSVTQVQHRQEILKDLLKNDNQRQLDVFSEEICGLADEQSQAYDKLQRDDPSHYLLYGHILDNGERYVRCIRHIRQRLPKMELRSQGLLRAADQLEELWNSSFFQALVSSQKSLRQKFDRLQYCMQIKYSTVRVKKYEGEADLSQKILAAFQKFRQDDQQDYRQKLREDPHAEHVEAAVLQCLSKLYPGEFEELTGYVQKFSRFLDQGLLQFCRELRFYVDWLRCTERMRAAGLPFCFPTFHTEKFYGNDFFDMALGEKIGSKVVKNDFCLEPGEQILVITGPNQGGKTTFARALGQLHYLASLGLDIPGTAAQVRLTDQVLTHFEREESSFQSSGRLQDDLQRMHTILETATADSFVVINEIFASTSAQDGVLMGKHIIDALCRRGCTTVLVTFLTELAESSPKAVSMVSTVDPEDPSVRTFHVVRKPPDGRTYAMTLASKHRLTYEQIIRRIQA